MMATHSELRRLGVIALGYLAAVAASALVAGAFLASASHDPAEIFLAVVVFASAYALVAGAPGFMLATFAALSLRISHWAFFFVAGGLNAALALLLANGFSGTGSLIRDVGAASVTGGAVGGLIFWLVARKLGLFAFSARSD